MRRVAIVNAGGYRDHSAEKGSYDSIVENLKWKLEQARIKERDSDEGRPAAEVRIVKSSEEALPWLHDEGTIIFVNRGLLGEAQRIAKWHPRLRGILMTGLLPEGEVILASKEWVTLELIEKMALP